MLVPISVVMPRAVGDPKCRIGPRVYEIVWGTMRMEAGEAARWPSVARVRRPSGLRRQKHFRGSAHAKRSAERNGALEGCAMMWNPF